MTNPCIMRRLFLALLFLPAIASAQVKLSGNIQSDLLLPQNDDAIGAEKQEDLQTNTYLNLQLTSKHVDAGARLEYLEHPLPGYENDFKGWGVPHFFVKGKTERAELTLGTFYEQFGSGFILRTYEERALGIDNSLLGGRLVAKPVKGVTVKLLTGKQRRYWHWNKALVSGADVELNLTDWFQQMEQHGTQLTLGGSWVNRREKNDHDVFTDATHRVNFPTYVNAWDLRANLTHGPWNLLAEYAQKTDDPSYANGYIFRKGSVAMLSGSYSKKGLSLLLQAKRSENMSFKSTGDPTKAIGISSAINHLPAFTTEHTYALAALYPYATQLADGEWAYQANLGYLFKRHTALGGRYGMQLKANYSYVRGIKRNFHPSPLTSPSSPLTSPSSPLTSDISTLTGTTVLGGTDGYHTSFFGWGDHTFYQDFNVQLSRKLSRDFKLSLMYMNQLYNQFVVEGHGSTVHSNIYVAEGKYQFSRKTTLRTELQYLTTHQDRGDWLFGLAELSLVPHWMVTVSDEYNAGETNKHYYLGQLTYTAGSHRLQLGYGRTVAGFNCSGGVCRYVPASRGLTLSYNYNF